MTADERDHLTQLLTRKAFDNDIKNCASAASSSAPASLILADIDHFKKVNDSHGHQTGDTVLREVAQRLAQTTQGKGRAYRYGGEEFAVLLPNHTPDEVLAVAERARVELEATQVAGVAVTSSYGVATYPLHATDVQGWIKKTDEALYDAKSLGRNLVRLAGELPPQPNQPRRVARKQAQAGHLSDEEKEQLRLQILRQGYAVCPHDEVPLTAHDITTYEESGRSFLVNCPGCGFNTSLPGPGRG
jgi:diguanylate cyclase (GGDEF)-like protein